MPISWLDHKPHAIAVYASWPALPSAHATLATGRPATALPGPVFHRLDCTSFCWRLRKSRLAEDPPDARVRFDPNGDEPIEVTVALKPKAPRRISNRLPATTNAFFECRGRSVS